MLLLLLLSEDLEELPLELREHLTERPVTQMP